MSAYARSAALRRGTVVRFVRTIAAGLAVCCAATPAFAQNRFVHGGSVPIYGIWAYSEPPAATIAAAGFDWFETGYPGQGWNASVNAALRAGQTMPLAYIDVSQRDPSLPTNYTGPDLGAGGGANRKVDVTHPSWQSWIQTRVDQAMGEGAAGIKWDDADPDANDNPPDCSGITDYVPNRLAKSRSQVNAALASIYAQVRAKYPGIIMVHNQGFKFACAHPEYVDGFTTEGLFTTRSYPSAYLQPWLDPFYWGPRYSATVNYLQPKGIPCIDLTEDVDPNTQPALDIYAAATAKNFVPYILNDVQFQQQGRALHIAPSWPSWNGYRPIDFGGVWARGRYSDYPNPVNGLMSCGAYADTVIFGTVNVDYEVHLCWRPSVPGIAAEYDFGGGYGYGQYGNYANPLTGGLSCASGYFDDVVFGSTNVDYRFHVCWRPHRAGDTSTLNFGGMYGYGRDYNYANPAYATPATNGLSCPSGFAAAGVLGSVNVDYPLYYCYEYLGTDFGGAWARGRYNDYTNPVNGMTTCGAYTDSVMLGSPGVDYEVHLCWRPKLPGRVAEYDFGGGYGSGQYANPITRGSSCPSGYTDSVMFGSINIDNPFHLCWRRHLAGGVSTVTLGGMYGYGQYSRYFNPATNTLECPQGFQAAGLLGTPNLDYPLFFCYGH